MPRKRRLLIELGRQGGKARAAKMSKRERSEAARRAANARWEAYRAAKLKAPQ